MAIEVGNVFEGRVTGVKPFGAFVALPEGRVGMVHISEVSNEFVQDINTVLHDGDEVKVQVINIAPDGKIALSIKRLLPPAPRQPREGRPAGPRPAAHPAASGSAHPPRSSFGRGGQTLPPSADQSFEDKLKQFMSVSDSKQSELNRYIAGKRGGRRRK